MTFRCTELANVIHRKVATDGMPSVGSSLNSPCVLLLGIDHARPPRYILLLPYTMALGVALSRAYPGNAPPAAWGPRTARLTRFSRTHE